MNELQTTKLPVLLRDLMQRSNGELVTMIFYLNNQLEIKSKELIEARQSLLERDKAHRRNLAMVKSLVNLKVAGTQRLRKKRSR